MNETHTAKEITAALLDALKHQGLCLKEALQMIEKGEEMAEIIHVPMVITVVDEGGNTVAMHRMDDSLLASISISYSKGYRLEGSFVLYDGYELSFTYEGAIDWSNQEPVRVGEVLDAAFDRGDLMENMATAVICYSLMLLQNQ